jgi:hypothetical protein
VCVLCAIHAINVSDAQVCLLFFQISGRALNERSPLISVCVSLQKEVSLMVYTGGPVKTFPSVYLKEDGLSVMYS